MTPLNSPERNETIRHYDGWPLSQEVIDKLIEIEKDIQKNEQGNPDKEEDQLNSSS